MSLFRRNIIRIAAVILLQIGMLAYVLPVSARGRTYKPFAIWLSHYLNRDASGSARSKIMELSRQTGEAPQLIAKASRIISSNAKDFTISLGKSQLSEKDIYHLLLVEWNLCHQASGMSNGAVIDHSKNGPFYNQEPALSPRLIGWETALCLPVPGKSATSYSNEKTVLPYARPLASGIAIGAP